MNAPGTFAALAVMAIVLMGCAGAPGYSEPQGSHGQLLVKLKGEPKKGLRGPRRDDIPEDYDFDLESGEQGRAFERVDYRDLPDVVVIADPGSALPGDGPTPARGVAELEKETEQKGNGQDGCQVGQHADEKAQRDVT